MLIESNLSQISPFDRCEREWISTSKLPSPTVKSGQCAESTARAESRYVPWDVDIARINFRANCGPISFAAILGAEVCSIIQFFPEFPDKPWCNFTQMKRALRSYGVRFQPLRAQLPSRGLALVQWLGPWTARDFFGRKSLNYTHWIAINNSLVFDHTVEQWLPLAEWKRDVAASFLQEIPGAIGWDVRFGIELKNSNTAVPVSMAAVCSMSPCC